MSSVVQVIICTKEVSVGARKNAYTLLVEIGRLFIKFCNTSKGTTAWCWLIAVRLQYVLADLRSCDMRFCALPASLPEAIQQYLGLVYAGLTGSVTMISCTVLALTRLVFEFHGKVDIVWGSCIVR